MRATQLARSKMPNASLLTPLFTSIGADVHCGAAASQILSCKVFGSNGGPRPMKPNPTTREKIQDVLDALSSNKRFPDEPYTKAEMIKWCESWIAIYDKLPKNMRVST
jgi:hypothetical protein